MQLFESEMRAFHLEKGDLKSVFSAGLKSPKLVAITSRRSNSLFQFIFVKDFASVTYVSHWSHACIDSLCDQRKL